MPLPSTSASTRSGSALIDPLPVTLLFDPYRGGHHAEYVCHLLQAWHTSGRRERLIAALPAGLLETQPDLCADALAAPEISIIELPPPLPNPTDPLWTMGRANARLLRSVIEEHRPARALAMYLDHLQLGLGLGLRFPFPVRISGILFRPTLHYPASTVSLKEQLRRVRKKLLLRGMAGNPHLEYVFSLDHTAVSPLQRIGLQAVPLPDPVAPSSTGASPYQPTVREYFGIEAPRRLFVLFGALDERKGLLPLLDALARLDSEQLRRVAVLLAGPLATHLRAEVADRVQRLQAHGGQVVLHDVFIPVGEIQPLLHAADLVLAPYQRHVGSSAVLIRAAAAGRPVLSQEYGFMGAQVRRHCLGRTVDTTTPDALTDALADAIEDPSAGFDPTKAATFAAANTPTTYADAILDRLAPR